MSSARPIGKKAALDVVQNILAYTLALSNCLGASQQDNAEKDFFKWCAKLDDFNKESDTVYSALINLVLLEKCDGKEFDLLRERLGKQQLVKPYHPALLSNFLHIDEPKPESISQYVEKYVPEKFAATHMREEIKVMFSNAVELCRIGFSTYEQLQERREKDLKEKITNPFDAQAVFTPLSNTIGGKAGHIIDTIMVDNENHSFPMLSILKTPISVRELLKTAAALKDSLEKLRNMLSLVIAQAERTVLKNMRDAAIAADSVQPVRSIQSASVTSIDSVNHAELHHKIYELDQALKKTEAHIAQLEAKEEEWKTVNVFGSSSPVHKTDEKIESIAAWLMLTPRFLKDIAVTMMSSTMSAAGLGAFSADILKNQETHGVEEKFLSYGAGIIPTLMRRAVSSSAMMQAEDDSMSVASPRLSSTRIDSPSPDDHHIMNIPVPISNEPKDLGVLSERNRNLESRNRQLLIDIARLENDNRLLQNSHRRPMTFKAYVGVIFVSIITVGLFLMGLNRVPGAEKVANLVNTSTAAIEGAMVVLGAFLGLRIILLVTRDMYLRCQQPTPEVAVAIDEDEESVVAHRPWRNSNNVVAQSMPRSTRQPLLAASESVSQSAQREDSIFQPQPFSDDILGIELVQPTIRSPFR